MGDDAMGLSLMGIGGRFPSGCVKPANLQDTSYCDQIDALNESDEADGGQTLLLYSLEHSHDKYQYQEV